MNRTKVFASTCAALAAVLASSRSAGAQGGPDSLDMIHMPPIVVTATRTPVPPDEVGSSITVVTREEIEQRQYRTVLEALRGVPGVAVAQAGPGGVASAFLRGAAADHTLVLLDGVEMNDPSSPNGAYDLANLLTENIERIEVVRGPQSTLYGSSAMGGVIQILTRRGEGPPAPTAAFEGGTHGAFQGTLGLAGSTETLAYSAALARRETDRVSAATAGSGDAERDGHRVGAFSGRLDWRAAAALALGLTVRASTAETDRDQEGPGGDDPNAVTEADEVALRVEGRFAGWGGRWEGTIGASLADHGREGRDDVDERHPQDRSRGTFDGRRWKIDWQNELALGEVQRLTFGVETERETAATTFASDGEFGPFESVFPEASARTTGAFVQHHAGFGEALFVTIGARIDDHSRFGTAATVRMTPTLYIVATGTRVKASYGTGFKAPTLFQLFDSQFGSAGLEPEESAGWDAGLEQDLAGGRVRVGVTAFATGFENLVGFEFPDGFRNVSAAETRGVEAWASAFPGAGVRLNGSYSFDEARDESGGEDDGKPLLRRPRHQGSLDLGVPVGHRGDVALGVRFMGEREDRDFSIFPAERVTLDGYSLMRMAASWDVSDTVRLFGRIENLLDEEYEEARHFGTEGRAAFVGVRAEF